MANSGSFTTTSADDKNLIFAWSISSQSIADNSTIINWSLTGGGTSSGYTMAGNFKVVINGVTVYSSSTRIQLRVGTVVASGTATISHTTDGSKTFSASAEAGIYAYAVNCTGSGSWTLTAIPRKATITSAPDFTDEQSPTLYYSNLAGNNATSLDACISLDGGTTATISYRSITKTGTSYTFSLTTAERNTLRNAMPNSKTATATFVVRTVIGGVTYTSTLNKTLTVVNANPTFSGVTYEDTNATTIAVTGNNQHIIQNKSTLQVNFPSATALKGASISSYSFSLNGATRTASASGTVSFGTVDSAENLTLTATATDSRGNSTSVSVAVTMLEYSSPTAVITLGRVNNYEDDTRLKVDGSVSSLNSHNTMTIQYRNKQSGGTYGSLTTIADDTEVSITCDKQYEYVFNIVVTDILGSTFNTEVTLPKGKFPMFIDTGLNAVGINEFPESGEALRVAGGIAHFEGDIKIQSTTVADFIIEQGTSGDWTYRKWNSGIAECWGTIERTNVSPYTTITNRLYAYAALNIVFPSNLFIEVPNVNYSAYAGTDIALSGTISDVLYTSGCNLYAVCPSNGAKTLRMYVQIKGRWK